MEGVVKEDWKDKAVILYETGKVKDYKTYGFKGYKKEGVLHGKEGEPIEIKKGVIFYVSSEDIDNKVWGSVFILWMYLAPLAGFTFAYLYLIVRSTFTRARVVMDISNALGNGELKVKTNMGNKEDELGMILNSLGKGLNDISILLESIKENTEEVCKDINGVDKIAGVTKTSFEDTHKKLEKSIQLLNSIIYGIENKLFSEIKSLITMINTLSSESVQMKNDIVQLTEINNRNLKELIINKDDIIINIKELNKTVSDYFINVSEQMKKVHSIVIKLGNIINDTKILSVNASIEAQKAGSQMGGFLVVASELNKLADVVDTELTKVTTSIMEMNKGVSILSEKIDSSKEGIEESEYKFNNLLKKFEDQNSSFMEKVDIINTFIDNVQSLGRSTEAINKVLGVMSKDIKEVDKANIEMKNAMEKGVKDMNRMINTILGMKNSMLRLKKGVERIKITK